MQTVVHRLPVGKHVGVVATAMGAHCTTGPATVDRRPTRLACTCTVGGRRLCTEHAIEGIPIPRKRPRKARQSHYKQWNEYIYASGRMKAVSKPYEAVRALYL